MVKVDMFNAAPGGYDGESDNDANKVRLAEKVMRRNKPGTSAQDWNKWSDESLDEMESTLAVQQFIQQLIRKDQSDVDTILAAPEQQDEGVWKYEHLRQFCLELNKITVRLQDECNPQVCTQMTATEQWIFLCAAHKNPKECSAIDYTRHTLDGAACLLNSNRYFPSRVNIKESSVQKLGSVCRRVYRIFSHAYFHHRQIYDEFEKETNLCKRFTRFVRNYDLMTVDSLIVPIDEEDESSTSINTTANIPTTTSTTEANAEAASPPKATDEQKEQPEHQQFNEEGCVREASSEKNESEA